MRALAVRNFKEILRDPLTLIFGLGFPIILLLLLTAIQSNIPVALFEIERLTSGITVFGLSFLTLFSAMLVSRDRESAFVVRLYTSPLKSYHFILGYFLAILPMGVFQGLACYACAVALGLKIQIGILYAILFLILVELPFIALGLMLGTLLNTKQVGGMCGAIVTNLTAFLSGVWFDLNLVGGAFKKAAYLLPFVHSVELERAALCGDLSKIGNHIFWVIGYALALTVLAVIFFLRQMKNN